MGRAIDTAGVVRRRAALRAGPVIAATGLLVAGCGSGGSAHTHTTRTGRLRARIPDLSVGAFK